VYPLIRIISYSFSDKSDKLYTDIILLPNKWTLNNYGNFFFYDAYRRGLFISVLRVVIGTIAGTMCSSLLAFILSRKKFIFKKGLAVFWTITMYAQAGLVPTMVLYKKIYLNHTFWVYIIPCMVSVLNVMVIRTYMKSIPDSFEESAQLDGAGYMKIFTSIVMPLCKPVYAATALFLAAYQWNSWFDNFIYNHFDDQYVTLMYELMKRINDFPYPSNNAGCFPSYPTVTAAGIIVAAIPLIIIYPFFQKWFVTGLTVGGIKE
jgi:putative aldouronate transport system permease protein